MLSAEGISDKGFLISYLLELNLQIARYRAPFHPYLIYLGWRFEGFKSALDARPESRGIPEAYMLTYVEDFRGAITQQMTSY